MRISTDRLHWAVLDAPGIKGGVLSEGLWPLLEEEVPVPVELLWAVGTPLPDGRLLVCAGLRAEIKGVADDELVPDRVPDSLPQDVDPAGLNLLVGEFEPKGKRAARDRSRLKSAAAVLLTSALVSIGLERRARVWLDEARKAEVATESLIASISPSLGWGKDDLAMELLKRQQVPLQDPRLPQDATPVIAGLIRVWPASIPSKPQTISATGQSTSISVLIPPPVAAADFLAALKTPSGWKLEEPRLVAVDKATRVSLELRREP